MKKINWLSQLNSTKKKKNLIKLWSSGLVFFLLLNYNIYNRTASFQSEVLASCFKLPFNVTNKHWWNMRKFKEKAWIVMKFKSVFVTSNIDISIQFCHWPLQGVIMFLWGLCLNMALRFYNIPVHVLSYGTRSSWDI